MFAQYYDHHTLPATPPPPYPYDPLDPPLSYAEHDAEHTGFSTACEFFPPGLPGPSSLHLPTPPSSGQRYLPGPAPYPSIDISTPALVRDDEGCMSGKEMMGLAESGSVEASASHQTPLATYTAQMVVWLWYGQHHQQAYSPPYADRSPNPFDRSAPYTPMHPLQVTPSPGFEQFVANLLQVTMVSHSVTLVALLYIYRLKSKNPIRADPGSEQRPFIASLILGNKYLDDNTYTNATWAELSGIPVVELNNMEHEFLQGLDYQLGVGKSEYTHWRNLLDGFIRARQHEAYVRLNQPRPSWSPQSILYTPSQTTVPMFADHVYRARSVSPSAIYAHYPAHSPSHLGKRNAVDAFAGDWPDHTAIQEAMRMPTGKITPAPEPSYAEPWAQGSATLGRSSSLNRRIARMPGDGGRRGSLSHIFPVGQPAEVDLRHTAARQWQAESYASQSWHGCSALLAPYENNGQPQAVPPEHLMFYALAAEAHPGQDGAPRKAILRHQLPHPQTYDPAQPIPYHSAVDYAGPSTHHPSYGYADPEPAQFANAGPPGWQYTVGADLPMLPLTGEGLGISGVSLFDESQGYDELYRQPQDWTSYAPRGAHVLDDRNVRSQWSSPLERQMRFD